MLDAEFLFEELGAVQRVQLLDSLALDVVGVKLDEDEEAFFILDFRW